MRFHLHLSKTHWFTLFFVLIFSIFFTTFFIWRLHYLNQLCNSQILPQFESSQWGAGKPLNPTQEELLDQAKLYYLVRQHDQCLRSYRFFFLF